MFEFIDHDGEDQWEIFLDHGILGNICSTKEVIAGLCYASERFEEVCEKRERENDVLLDELLVDQRRIP